MLCAKEERLLMNKSVYDLMDSGNTNDIAILSQVAHMYYDLKMSQPEIAEKLYFSRSKVSRMLNKALELGIVDIKIKRFLARMPSFERKIESLFGLKQAMVMTNFDESDDEDAQDGLFNYAAMYVSSQLKGSYVLGITGSETVTRVVHKLTKIHACDLEVVQTIGATISKYMSGELVNFIAQTYGGTAHFLNTPLYVDDIYVKEMLLRDPAVMKALHLMKHCNLILMGIGKFNVDGDMPNWYGYMTSEHREEMESLGAVGSICAQFFDINGNLLSCDWNQKCITIPWEDIKRADLRVAIAAGKSKVSSILGALRGKLVDVLITDTTTAAQVIEQEKILQKEP